MTDTLDAWRDFNTAMVGATAALTGLAIVASSVNIAAIIKATSLTARLAASIASLLMAFTASAVGLVPNISLPDVGIVVLLAALTSAVFQTSAARRIVQSAATGNSRRVVNIVLSFLPVVAYLTGGILLISAHPSGLGAVAAGSLLAIFTAVVVSWIVLVEVLR